ncbi:MAG: hypothetical protein ACLSHG_10500 [Oscillospiraceae bacterium]
MPSRAPLSRRATRSSGGATIPLGERGTPADIDQLRAITDGAARHPSPREGIAAYARWMRKFDDHHRAERQPHLPAAHEQPADVSGVSGR